MKDEIVMNDDDNNDNDAFSKSYHCKRPQCAISWVTPNYKSNMQDDFHDYFEYQNNFFVSGKHSRKKGK